MLRSLAVMLSAFCLTAPMGAGALTDELLTGAIIEVNVGYSGDGTAVASAIKLLGGVILIQDRALKVFVVQSPDAFGLVSSLTKRSDVRYAEVNEAVAPMDAWSSGTRWSSTTTDATRWSTTEGTATRWSGADWDATRWSEAGWDATRWSGAGWNGVSWTGVSADGSSVKILGVDPGFPYQWGLGAINAPGAWLTSIGKLNRNICVIDSGIDWTHPDLAPNMWRSTKGTYGYNFVNNSAWPMDDAGHGTHVAGIAAAVTGNGLGIAGVAQARMMAVKVLDASGVGKESSAAFALRWCADNGANIASLSLGTDKDKGVLRDGVAYAISKGVLITAAAGNDGCACKRYPAAYSGVLAVASYNNTGTRSSFSNTGSWIALSAPGENITSTYVGGYRVGSGTSQATPFVAGAAALAWGANTKLTAAKVSSILTSTAWDLGPAGKDTQFGYGGVNAHAAVDAAKVAKTSSFG